MFGALQCWKMVLRLIARVPQHFLSTFTEDLSICISPPLSLEKNVMILVDRVDTRYTRFAKELHAEIEIALKQSSTVQ